jgi:hypothetical protein
MMGSWGWDDILGYSTLVEIPFYRKSWQKKESGQFPKDRICLTAFLQ